MENIHIIGAGVSGLVAAIELERAGHAPVVIEKTDRVGGRVKTDEQDGRLFDHGFQVLLTSYPAAKRYLDFDALELQRFLPGAVIFKEGEQHTLGDPLRHLPFCWATAFAPIATLNDKWKVWQLSNEVKKVSIEQIFAAPETTTKAFLQEYGFSDKIIQNFFSPFYSGIFLEPDLKTSSRMFRFVFKMFAEGHAAIPKQGIGAIAGQLKSQLKRTTFLMNTGVQQVKNDKVVLEDGTERASDFTIIASDPNGLVEGYQKPEVDWHSCYNLYFEVERSILQQPIIGLVAAPDALINNLHFPTDLARMTGKPVLSVTVVKEHQLSDTELVARVEQELANYCGIEQATFLRKYHIKKALPVLNDLQYAPKSEAVHLNDRLFLAGDYLANASLNAAMEAGAMAACELVGKLAAV